MKPAFKVVVFIVILALVIVPLATSTSIQILAMYTKNRVELGEYRLII